MVLCLLFQLYVQQIAKDKALITSMDSKHQHEHGEDKEWKELARSLPAGVRRRLSGQPSQTFPWTPAAALGTALGHPPT